MKLVHPDIETPIDFIENKINILVLENQTMFSNMIMELLSEFAGIESKYVLSKKFNPIDISKTCDICIDLFSLDANSKKTLNKLYLRLKELSMDGDFYLKSNILTGQILHYLQLLIDESDYNLTHRQELDAQAMFKLFDVKFATTAATILEKLLEYINIMQEFCAIELFVFVNLKCYLSVEEIEEFYQEVFYKKINILLIENTSREKLASETLYIIDDDLCQIL